MIASAIIFGLAYGAILVLFWRTTQQIEQERHSWRSERSELLNRIQAPERIYRPAESAPAPLHVVPDEEGELALVGRVVDLPRGDED